MPALLPAFQAHAPQQAAMQKQNRQQQYQTKML
jgi:hypothetical protein